MVSLNPQALLQEDVPYFDLTTHALGIGDRPATIRFTTRDRVCLGGSEMAAQVLKSVGAEVTLALATGDRLEAGVTVLAAQGSARSLHTAWKTAQNILEYACGVATLTDRMVRAATDANPDAMLYTTRKHVPGTKAIAIDAILAAGAYPHRLGLSETVLIFEQHLNFVGGIEGLVSRLPQLKRQVKEKKIIVELKQPDDAVPLAKAGVDGIQFDKLKPKALSAAIARLKSEFPHLLILAAGGIQFSNIADYAATGADGLVSTAPYYANPADIGVSLEPI